MSRVTPIDPSTASPELQDTLNTVRTKMGGRLPNLVTIFAQAPAALHGYLGFSAALQGGSLSPELRERLALVVAQANGCDYCLAAHSTLGKMRGLSEEEILLSRRGQASDSRQDAAVRFALAVVEQRGRVSEGDLAAIRGAGYSEAEIIEITANVVYNIFTNYVNNVADTDIDFPAAQPLSGAAD